MQPLTNFGQGEQLDVEFKSDRRTMPDREIYEEVVSLANSKGGVLLIGVEDDGTITGAHPRHGNATDPPKLQSAIFNNTAPSINTRISLSRSGGSIAEKDVQIWQIKAARLPTSVDFLCQGVNRLNIYERYHMRARIGFYPL